MTPYAELATSSNFSFLRGASSARDLVLTSLLLGHTGIGIADRNTLAGVVRAWSTLEDLRRDGLPQPEKQRAGDGPGEHAWIEHPDIDGLKAHAADIKQLAGDFRLVVGARLVFRDGAPDVLAYPESRTGWARLCRLLTEGNLRGKKGECLLDLADLTRDANGLLLIVMPGTTNSIDSALERLVHAAPGAVWLGAARFHDGNDERRLERLKAMACNAGVPLIAVNDVLYHAPEQRDLQDVMTCIREGVTIDTAGRLLEANAERHLKPSAEMQRLFRNAPEAIDETQSFLQRIDFDLSQLRYEYPDEPVPPGWKDQDWLEDRTWAHAAMRYPDGVPAKVRQLLDHELAFISKHDLARYFLTIYDIVRVAKDKGILCQGRGSAANSAVCYALGITSVDPAQFDVLFARFMSDERREPPDIDVDFEHERREEIIQHIYQRYGRHRAGIIATVIHYRPRSAMREVGKVFGLSEDITSRLAGLVWGSWGGSLNDEHIRQAGFNPANPVIRRTLGLAARLLGFPRHLSQHVGGFVLARDRLDELAPIGNAAMDDRTFIEWDKDDVDALGLMKIDVLALGMLTCIRKAFDLIHQHGGAQYNLQTVPQEDAAVYDMLSRGDSIGVFQVESRAQINMLPRLRPATFYDLVIEVAIVRPGPIQGDMVHPYLRRRNGEEPVDFPAPDPAHGPVDELRQVLGKTLGVPLFQEQAMRLAMVAAQFTDAEANGLRKAMATFRNVGTIHTFETKMVERMVQRGYDRDFSQRCFEQIKGFGSYGFPESHAAAFAQLAYVSSWLKYYYPAAFACALLNSQPMGFYAPAQIVRDAREHGVEVRSVDVNASTWDNTLERHADGQLALRLGFRQVDGLIKGELECLADVRGSGYASIEDLAERAQPSERTLHALADADAFQSIRIDRRRALWIARRLPKSSPLPLFRFANDLGLGEDPVVDLPALSLGEHVATDYQTTRLSLKAHPMAILRPLFRKDAVDTCAEVAGKRDGAWARNAGIVLVRQRPGNGKAIFITLEDETGITNIVLWLRTFERFRSEVMSARLLLVEGRVQKSPEGVTHLMGVRLFDKTSYLDQLPDIGSPNSSQPKGISANTGNAPSMRHPRDVRILPKSRDFH